ncbi:head-tail joining protein [Sphingomonas sp. Leaf4]|uniref:head-tail joining protein n=1 Tax=Sphingomonas sp. Leaf4 TaxID=2876553 RepID=UPI001E418323|nr:hypothetical protein [Sphingomonas sp. Leaf4]
MPIESPDDIASFFNEEEFGTSVRIDGQGPFAAIREEGSAMASWGDGEYVQPKTRFLFPTLPAVALVEGGTIEIVDSGEQFEVFGAPTNDEGIWSVTGSPIA